MGEGTVPYFQKDKSYKAGCSWKPPNGLDSMIVKAATRYGIEADIVAATIYRESGCRVDAVGSSGEIGLMQINPNVWRNEIESVHGIRFEAIKQDPATNVMIGAYILSTFRDDGLREMFRRYNGSGKKAERYADEQMHVLKQLNGTS